MTHLFTEVAGLGVVEEAGSTHTLHVFFPASVRGASGAAGQWDVVNYSWRFVFYLHLRDKITLATV
jgi:hypothetical protein